MFTLPDGADLQAAPGSVETRRSLKDIKPACSSFVPGHGLERGIVMQKTRDRELWEKERVEEHRGCPPPPDLSDVAPLKWPL